MHITSEMTTEKDKHGQDIIELSINKCPFMLCQMFGLYIFQD